MTGSSLVLYHFGSALHVLVLVISGGVEVSTSLGITAFAEQEFGHMSRKVG